MLGIAKTLGLLIFYCVHSINMYSSGDWACIWCWTRLALFVQVQNDLYSTFIARFIITYEVLSLVMCTHILNVLDGSLLVSIKSFFHYVLTFELNGLTTLCSFRTFIRMARVYAQLILKNPIKGEPLLFYAEKKSKAHCSWSTNAWGCLPAVPFLVPWPWGNRRGNPSAYFRSWDNYSVIHSTIL